MIGSLTYQDYLKLYENDQIISNYFNISQIQPSSLDLSLSSECYEVKYSFLSPKNKVREKLENLIVKKINLNKKHTFEINKTYIVKLNEKLNLNNEIFGHCNPKSSTGRLDIFCRTIVDYADEYEKIPKNYKGDIFLEITSRSFNIKLESGNKLNQLRLISKNHNYINDDELGKINLKNKIVFTENNLSFKIDNGLKLSVNLCDLKEAVAYSAKLNAPILDFNKINYHRISDYWDPVITKKKINFN